MPSSLTGDFEAVLQVSGGTINRLLASMHQNAFANTNLPSFPHSLWIRIGDDHAIDGVRGSLQAQLSVPRVDLIQGATDRFLLEVGARVRYKPDPGTSPFPQFIHGTVRAEYRIEDIDPHCLGWAQRAADYLWIRVAKDSVQFDGTWDDDSSGLHVPRSIEELDAEAQATHASITNQVAGLLATTFAATPHRVSKRFRRGSMRSLSAGIGGSAVAIPIGLSGEPVGQIASIGSLLLDDADFGIAVSRDYIESAAQPALDGIQGLQHSFHASVDLGVGGGAEVDYSVRVDNATLQWTGMGSYGLITLSLTGQGWCPRLYTSGLANIDPPQAKDLRMSFDAAQTLLVGFDQPSERLTVVAPWFMPPSVHINYSGPYGGIVTSQAKAGIAAALQAQVPGAIVQVQPLLDALTSYQRKAELIDQLRTLDDQAGARFEEAVFSDDGVVLRGTIPLTPRQRPAVSFQETVEQDGFSALLSWIPGGRIDNLEWSWSLVGQPGSPSTATFEDRFVLRRTPARVGPFGLTIGLTQPLPGIDGAGRVCLTVSGVQVDAVTGRVVPVRSVRSCTGYRLNTTVSVLGKRLFLRDLTGQSHDVPLDQLALVDAAAPSATTGSNTLLLYVDEQIDQDTMASLRRGLEATVREDAGLLLLVLFREGRLRAAAPGLETELHDLSAALGVATIVNEDVGGGWATAFALPSATGEESWRLLSPGGGVTWMLDGRATAAALASALDGCLIPSPPAKAVPIGLGIEIGAKVPAQALDPGMFAVPDAHCPPIGIDRIGMAGSLVGFVRAGSAASMAQLRRLAARQGEPSDTGPFVLAIVDGADAREVETMQQELGLDVALLPDAAGAITDRFAVQIWPTILRLDRTGTVSGIEIGAVAHPHDPEDSEASEAAP